MLAIGIWLKLDFLRWAVIILTIVMVLAAEFFNTAVEILADFACKKEIFPEIKLLKDISAGAVLITATGAAAVGGLLLFIPAIKKIFF